MTYSEIISNMAARLESEINDANEYLDMAEAAEKLAGIEMNEELSTGLYGVAEDEFTHAEFIVEMIDCWHGSIPEETRQHFNELRCRYERCFCE